MSDLCKLINKDQAKLVYGCCCFAFVVVAVAVSVAVVVGGDVVMVVLLHSF